MPLTTSPIPPIPLALTVDDMQSRSNSFVGTAQYVSPELLTAKPLPDPSKSASGAAQAPPPPPACADFWAFGCVLFQFITGKTPFRAPNEYLIFQKITKLEYEFPPDFPEDARDLVSNLLVLDPHQRLGAVHGVEDIKAHRYFRGIDWNSIWTVEPPPIRTGIAPPTVFPKQLLVLEESSLDDASGEEGDEEELNEEIANDDEDDEDRRGPPPIVPHPEMLPPPSPAASARQADFVWPSIASVSGGDASGNRHQNGGTGGRSYRSSLSSSAGANSNNTNSNSNDPGSANSYGSMQQQQSAYLQQNRQQQEGGSKPVRHRSSSSGRW